MSEQQNSTNTIDERQKQISLWVAGIFAALSSAFMLISIYAVVRQGRFDLEDTILMPTTVVLTFGSLLSYFLIRQGRYQTGSELLFIAMLIMPVMATLMLSNILLIAIAFALIFSGLIYNWVLLKTSKPRALVSIALEILAFIGIELWNPGFRGLSDVAVNATPVVIALAMVVLLAFIVRQSWGIITYSISNRLTALVLVITVPLLFGVLTYTLLRARSEIQAQALHNLQQNNQSLATNVSTWLEQHVRTTKEMSMLPDITSMNSARQEATLKVVASAHPNLFLVHTLDLKGMDVARNDDAAPIDYSDRAWFLNAKEGEPITFDVVISRTLGKPVLAISAPIYNESKTIVGVASVTSELSEISKEVLNNEAGQGITFIVDANNRVVAHPDPTYTEGELRDLSVYPPVVALGEGKTGQLTFTDENGIAWVAYVDRLDNGWGIIAQQTEAELYASQNQFTNVAGALTVIGTLILFALSWFVIRRSLQPIGALTTTVAAIAAGDLSRIAEVKSQDEIGVLASTFNKMTTQLRESFATLEQRVAERTRNLELAGEVGRTVSQVRALDVMLTDAAELIRQQFNLYYVQVYLTDPSQSHLNLEAGTGQVGEQLLARKHRLPLNTASINGRAAIEKHSVVISNTAESSSFKPNPLLPDTRSEMAVPLMIGDRVVGVLDMQSEHADSLSQDILPAFEALAGQLAIAVQNANLLAETEQARAQMEAQARHLIREGWNEHLDAIHKPEKFGYVFDRNEITSITDADQSQLLENSNAISAPIAMAGESLGSLVVELDDDTRAEQTTELVNIVARQVAQQIENLRLLESAERYRFEAEQASSRQTREGWQAYINARTSDSLSYLYDLTQVRPSNDGKEDTSALTLPLKVRDEAIGRLSVQGLPSEDKESVELANVVAERLSEHIESLRQYDQTQSALTQSEKLFEASRSLTQATDLQELIAAAVTTLGIPEVNRALLTTFEYDKRGEVEQLNIIANWWSGDGHEVTPVGTRYSLEVIRAMPMFVSPTPVFFNDTLHDERVDETTLELVKKLNLRAVAALPLHLGARQIGSLILEAEEPHRFTQDESRLFTALAPQIATVLENRRQFEHARQQAEYESMLNAISQKIQSATNVEAVLQIAARELGRALGAPLTIAQLGMRNSNGNGNE